MPQMHPLLWTILFIFSLSSLIMTTSIVFFSLEKPTLNSLSSKTPITEGLNWKW